MLEMMDTERTIDEDDLAAGGFAPAYGEASARVPSNPAHHPQDLSPL